MARRDWWLVQEPTYLAWMGQTAGYETAFEADCGSALVDRGAARGAADGVIYGTIATADATRALSGAEADRGYAATLAGAYQTYQQAVATADRTYDLAVAVAERDLELGGSQEDYESALAAARTARALTQRAAADAYASTQVTAEGDWKLSLAEADLAYVQTVGPAQIDFVEAYGAAELSYVTDVASARVTRVTNVATADAAYLVQEAASLESALVTLSVTHPSPWATYHAAIKAARSDATAIVAPARAARDIALAEATRDLEIAQIEARIALDVALTEAEMADWVASAAAAVDRVEAEQDVLEVLAIAAGARGILQARAAQGEDQPNDTPPEIDPGMVGDSAVRETVAPAYAAPTDWSEDSGSVYFCSAQQQNNAPAHHTIPIPEGTKYIERTWWKDKDGKICVNDVYFGDIPEKENGYRPLDCLGRSFISEFDGEASWWRGTTWFELVDGHWEYRPSAPYKTSVSIPLPYLNSLGTPELRENYGRLDEELKQAATDVAKYTAQAAMFVLPGPEDFLFMAFWKLAGRRGLGCTLQGGRWVLTKCGKVLGPAEEKLELELVYRYVRKECGVTSRQLTNAAELCNKRIKSWILRADVDEATIRAKIVQMEQDFFQLGGDYKPLANDVSNWGTTKWLGGRPVIHLDNDYASLGTLVEELFHVQQLQKIRLAYFAKFKRFPSGAELDAYIMSPNMKEKLEKEAAEFLKSLGFEVLSIGG